MLYDTEEHLGIVGTIVSIGVTLITSILNDANKKMEELRAQRELATTKTVIDALDRQIEQQQVIIDEAKKKLEEAKRTEIIKTTGSYIAIGAAALVGLFIITRSR